MLDAPMLDAPMLDAPMLDAPTLDAPMLDAMLDAGPDACEETACVTGRAGVCDPGVVDCSSMTCVSDREAIIELCGNELDDDCDGDTDEGGCEDCEDRFRDGRLYLFCIDPERWVDARDACSAYGMRIVAIESDEERVWVQDQVEDIDDGDRDSWWTGLYTPIAGSDNRSDHRWRPDGSGDPAPTFGYWLTGEPNNPSEDCVRIRDDPDRRWTDRECDNGGSSFPFICEPD